MMDRKDEAATEAEKDTAGWKVYSNGSDIDGMAGAGAGLY